MCPSLILVKTSKSVNRGQDEPQLKGAESMKVEPQ